VVEEAPSPFLDAKTREAMGAQSVALAKAVGYDSAGTVEFVVAQDRTFYFLEMNTRLQVEHPVTELVTGIDIVEEMIRVAAGEPLRIRQQDVKLDGWAVESRVYAEDPYRNFLPSIGRLTLYRPPAETRAPSATVRVDTGVFEGGEISIYYDPMIAKLVTHAPNRAGAIATHADALDRFVIGGIRHNIPFLSALMRHPRWQAGALSTGFIAEEFPGGFRQVHPDNDTARTIAAIAAAIDHTYETRRRRISGQLRQRDADRGERIVRMGDDEIALRIETVAGGFAVHFSGSDAAPLTLASSWRPGDPLWSGSIDGRDLSAQVRPVLSGLHLSHAGIEVIARVYTQGGAAAARLMPVKAVSNSGKLVLCPMPGLVRSIAVSVGQEVKAGEPLAVVEAMKMENLLRAERDGIVKRVVAKPGDSLAVDAVILEFA
jgi:propionyl-CoA carboxylase alpha chain